MSIPLVKSSAINNNINIKPLLSEYEAFMWEMLYDAIFVARENELADKDLDELPFLKKYIENWGERKDDYGYVAIDHNNQPLGAVWVRQFKREDGAWGYIDDATPELNIAVIKHARNMGVGTCLLNAILNSLEGKYNRISLSVHPKNRCINLYQQKGFKVYKRAENALTMLKAF